MEEIEQLRARMQRFRTLGASMREQAEALPALVVGPFEGRCSPELAAVMHTIVQACAGLMRVDAKYIDKILAGEFDE